ncbi:MAG: tetratricopeptide repeat protein [Bryobacteraceae bacterium]
MKNSQRVLIAALVLTVLPALAWAQRMSQRSSGLSILVSGRVVMADGSPVPPAIVIQKVCGGSPETVARTDINGSFRFQWSRSVSPLMPDASESGARQSNNGGYGGSDPFGNRMLDCELRANLAGFRSDRVDLSKIDAAENFDVGSIALHRLKDAEGNSISAASLQAPKKAAKAYESGLQSLAKNKPEDAARDFETAVAIFPNYAEAWVALGKLREEQKSYGPAKEAYVKAVEADPNLVFPYTELGFLAIQQHQWEEGARYLDRALKLDPAGYPEAWYADAVADYNLKLYDAAEAGVREYFRRNAQNPNPRAHYLLAIALIEKGDRAAGATELKKYIALDPNAPDIGTLKERLADLEKEIGDQP